MPSVSVIIPLYNGERFIDDALESVFEQTYRDYEIICVDDGSTDSSRKALERYRDHMLILEQSNSGQAAARNVGAKKARGRYLAFLDQDDRWYPSKLEQQMAVLEVDCDAVMVHCDMDWIDEAGHVIQRGVATRTRSTIQKGLTMTQLVGRDPHIYPSTTLIRRAAFDAVGGFDPELRCGEDIDLMLRLRQQGKFLFQEQVGTQYRKHGTNFSRSASDAMFSCGEKFFRKLQGLYQADPYKLLIIDQFLARIYSDWGRMKMKNGNHTEARRLLIQSLKYYPWKFRTYSRLVRALLGITG